MAADGDATLHPDDLREVVARYRRRIARFGTAAASLNSGGEEKQRVRHLVHATALLDGTNVLDIGCGLGAFYDFLRARGKTCDYTGYDIVPEYIDSCREAHPEADFAVRNVLAEGIQGAYDSVVISQAFNNRYHHSDNVQIVKNILTLAFQHARISVSMDMMSTYVDYRDEDLFYYSPEEIFRFAKTLTRRVLLRHDYRPFEFCVQLFRGESGDYVP